VNHDYALCAFVEYPASALLSEEQQHDVKEGGGGEEDEGEGGSSNPPHSYYYNITLSSYQVNIWFADDVLLTPTRLVITFVASTSARQW
jgi:hypothetical protein